MVLSIVSIRDILLWGFYASYYLLWISLLCYGVGGFSSFKYFTPSLRRSLATGFISFSIFLKTGVAFRVLAAAITVQSARARWRCFSVLLPVLLFPLLCLLSGFSALSIPGSLVLPCWGFPGLRLHRFCLLCIVAR